MSRTDASVRHFASGAGKSSAFPFVTPTTGFYTCLHEMARDYVAGCECSKAIVAWRDAVVGGLAATAITGSNLIIVFVKRLLRAMQGRGRRQRRGH